MSGSEKISRREFFKYFALGAVGIFGGLAVWPRELFGQVLTLEEKLEKNMESALRPLGSAWISKYRFTATHPIAGSYEINLLIDQPDKESFRLVIYPTLWKKDVDIEKVEIYLITPYQSRFEYEDLMVFLNKQDKRTNYVSTDMSYGANLELLLDKTTNLIFNVTNKLGIAKKDVNELLMAIPGLFEDPSSDSKAKQEAIEEGNLILRAPVYLKKISFDGNINTGALSTGHVKLYDLRIREGEKAIAAMLIKPQLYVYTDINLISAGFKPIGKLTIQINPDLYGKKGEYK